MGTFNAAPTTAAAGVAALELIRSTDACGQAIAYGDKLIDSLNEMFNEENVSWISYGTYGGFHVFLNPENISTTRQRIEAGEHSHDTLKAPVVPALRMKLRIGVLLHGVDIQGWPGAPVTAAHSDADLVHTVEAFRQTIRLLREEGDLD
jgi:glutamate-1-semialdehyde 2,1-aminomutase